MNQEIAE